MNSTKFIYKYSVFYFALFFAFALLGFWNSYVTRFDEQPTLRNHTHGLLMTLWCLTLITQAYWVRTNQWKWHRITGKLFRLV